MVGSANTYTPSRIQNARCPIRARTASRATSFPTIVMTWAVSVLSHDRTARFMSGVSKKRARVLRRKKSSSDISRNGATSNTVRPHLPVIVDVHQLFFRSAVRVLQYRSVAFVTYVSEHHAQFAKEAMACQSLDNDEILNVRWATEDPNPVQKVAEKRRLEEMGQEAIKARMDPRIVDAMRSVRAL